MPTELKGCQNELVREPMPLYSQALDLALLWNAKAACTFAIKWFFYQEGVLDEALAFSPWPHHYRQHVFYRRARYRERVKRIPLLGDRVVKFVRDPFDRAVGGYLSYCREASGWSSAQHEHMQAALRKHLGGERSSAQRFSFREFVSFLGSLDLDEADIHVRRQTLLCERLGQFPDLNVVRVEQATEALPKLEDQLGLRRSDPASFRHSAHDSVRGPATGFVGDVRYGDITGQTVPASSAFYDDELIERVARLYAEDIERYGYRPPR